MSAARRVRVEWSRTANALLENLSRTGRGRKQAVAAAADAFLAVAALWLAYGVRLGQPFSDFRSTWYVFAAMAVVTVLVFSGFGIYRWVVRSSNQRLYRQIAKGCVGSALAMVLLIYLVPPDRNNPRSLFVIYGLLLFAGTASVRMLWRSRFDSDARGEPIALYGAGENGRRLARLLASGTEYRPVAFIDDDPALAGSTVEGLRVLDGSREDLRRELDRRDVGHVVLTIAALAPRRLEAMLARFDAMSLPVKTVPSLTELVSGDTGPGQIRDVSIADILGRAEVQPDTALMGRRVTGRSVLVTGGGGSIGSELARQILYLSPATLVVLDSSEPALYQITEELRAVLARTDGPACRFVPMLGSVKDRTALDRVMREHAVDTVFHAAAYKHVPIIEHQPDQGVETNVFGTLTLVEAAVDAGVKDLVLVSTDKAVRPTNAMGASKRVAELILQAATRTQSVTRLSMVRFGNVLGSSGSVVPKFKRQILAGGPVTLTDDRMTRYFMTIPEAAQLVLQAGAIARGGDVFVLDMGEPVRIADLARSMIRLYGRGVKGETGREDDIEIVVEGMRPGEKLYEELFLTSEHRETGVPKISTADEAWLEPAELERRLGRLREAIDAHDAVRLRAELFELIHAGTHRADAADRDGADPKADPAVADPAVRKAVAV